MASKELEIDVAASKAYYGNSTEFKIANKLSRAERLALSKEEWMEQYGAAMISEGWFLGHRPKWLNDPEGKWMQDMGRSGGRTPLWMQPTWHLKDLDCPPGRDRVERTLDERKRDGEVPLWAQRMNLSGGYQGDQCATIYGLRDIYKPTEKTDARSMYERFQADFDRTLNYELPDIADPADGRFWKCGQAQGISTNPYELRIAITGRRKPMAFGPCTASVVVDGEMHTFGGAFLEVGHWHPNIEFPGYSLEHPGYRHVNLRVQTSEESGLSGEQGLCEVLEMVQDTFGHIGDVMEQEAEAYIERQGGFYPQEDFILTQIPMTHDA